MKNLILLIPFLIISCSTPHKYYRYNTKKGISYSSNGVDLLKGDLYTPKRDGLLPALVVVHGGGWVKGSRKEMSSVARRLAKRGYISFNITYRLGPKYKYPLAIHDVKEAIRFLKSNAKKFNIDPSRVGVMGYSAGGHLSLMAGTNTKLKRFEGESKHPVKDTKVKAVVAGAPPTDLTLFNENPSTNGWIGPKDKNIKLFKEASPINYVSQKTASTFIYHGKHDWIVDERHAQLYVKKLDKYGIKNQLHQMNLGHIFNFLFDMEEVDKAITFLDKSM